MIVISKNKIHHEYFEGGLKVMVDIGATESSLLRYLTESVLVEEDVTVEDVLRHLIDYQEDLSFAFEASLGGYPLEIFLDELIADKPAEDHLIYAEFSHELSITDGFINYAPRFGAMGKDIIGGTDEPIAYSIELAPVAAYKHLPIVLNKEYSVVRTDDVDGKQVETVIMTAEKDFTLYEFLHAILFEMSYYGTPEMRSATLKEVVASIGSDGTLEHISVAQVEQMKISEIARLEEELKVSVAKEDYEKSAELRDRIDQLKRGDKSENDPGTNGTP